MASNNENRHDLDITQIVNNVSDNPNEIIEGETIHERADFSEKELDEFLESLSTDHFEKIQNFFNTMPRLKHEIKFKNPKTKKQNKITLEGLQSFFE